jgi:peptidoglycan/LPS O-acetylase OafA/YrhL
MFVVFDHLSTHVLRGPRHVITPWFDTGMYGVMVFFLVSGYIVPASLERKGSVRGFWVSRVFRLYPMWVIAVAAVLVLAVLGVAGLRGADEYPAASTVAHLLMLQDLLGIRNAVNVLWTLSYEMVFYLLITFLFVVRAHRRSAGVAASLAVVALVVGGTLPMQALSGGDLSTRMVIIVAAVMIVAGLAAAPAVLGDDLHPGGGDVRCGDGVLAPPRTAVPGVDRTGELLRVPAAPTAARSVLRRSVDARP